MDLQEENLFDKAMSDYKSGLPLKQIIKDFESITQSSPANPVGWTCLAWLQLLTEQNNEALRSARLAVKLNAQDPQARVNLSLALLETNSKGVRDHIDFVKRAMMLLPELEEELRESIIDGLHRKPDWRSLLKIKKWLDI